MEAEKFLTETRTTGELKAITAHWNDRPFDEIQEIANVLRQNQSTLIIFGTSHEGRVRMLCTRSNDLTTINAGALLQDITQKLGGRGGGSPEMAQGGTPQASHDKVLETFKISIDSITS